VFTAGDMRKEKALQAIKYPAPLEMPELMIRAKILDSEAYEGVDTKVMSAASH
jgi:hypothetical protein